MNFDFNFDTLPGLAPQGGKPVEVDPDPEDKKPKRRETVCLERSDRHVYRRAYGVTKLLECAGMELKDGHSYHFITGGDVDSLSYLQLILLYQPLDYCLFSTWCMAAEDILAFDEWLAAGKIKKLDAYVGEIFPSSYRIEWAMLTKLFEKRKCGRIAVFRNHAKIYAGAGPKFTFGIETSANINTNPRTENGCITIGREIYQFYRDYFDGIQSIVKT
jgi:hypothetical protein